LTKSGLVERLIEPAIRSDGGPCVLGPDRGDEQADGGVQAQQPAGLAASYRRVGVLPPELSN
jgi:hypothetical protein